MTRSLCAAALVLAACSSASGGSETGNPVAQRIGLNARSTDPDAVAVAVSSGAAGTVIDEAWVAFGEFTFLSGEACATLGDNDYTGPTAHAADLARPDARITVEVASGDYCGLVVPLPIESPSLPDDAPAELAAHNIVLRGERADGVPFLLTNPEQDELELAAQDGAFEVAAQGTRLLLSFDVAVWMDGVDLAGAEVGDDGTILIDAANNRGLLDAFEFNLECSLELYDDEDGDGAVGTDDPLLARCAPE